MALVQSKTAVVCRVFDVTATGLQTPRDCGEDKTRRDKIPRSPSLQLCFVVENQFNVGILCLLVRVNLVPICSASFAEYCSSEPRHKACTFSLTVA